MLGGASASGQLLNEVHSLDVRAKRATSSRAPRCYPTFMYLRMDPLAERCGSFSGQVSSLLCSSFGSVSHPALRDGRRAEAASPPPPLSSPRTPSDAHGRELTDTVAANATSVAAQPRLRPPPPVMVARSPMLPPPARAAGRAFEWLPTCTPAPVAALPVAPAVAPPADPGDDPARTADGTVPCSRPMSRLVSPSLQPVAPQTLASSDAMPSSQMPSSQMPSSQWRGSGGIWGGGRGGGGRGG